MNEMYYKPNTLWKGKTAITKLNEINGKSNQEILKWFEKQCYWQKHKRPPKITHIPHYEINKVGEVHLFSFLEILYTEININKYLCNRCRFKI